MVVKKAIEDINKLGSISKKLEYYNNYFWPPVHVGFYHEPVGFKFDGEQHKLFCLCDQCKDKSPISDFETYRDIRNEETQRIADFFESKLDYETKVEYYFKISQDCGTTSFTLTFVPDKMEEMDIKVLPYKNIYTIDITPKDNTEMSILKSNLKQRLLTGKYSFFVAQFTFEKRVENLEKLLKNKIDTESRNDILKEEYDKIRKLKINKDSDKTLDKTLFKILVVAEKISLGKHSESSTRFSKLEITILAEDVFKYEDYLNKLYKENNSSKELISALSDVKSIIKEEDNPYPKIFKNYAAYTIFLNLFNEFGNTKENLANYSFVFHKMTYEDLIYSDLKQLSYFSFLNEFDISIDRIKPYSNIGKIRYRESIYTKVK